MSVMYVTSTVLANSSKQLMLLNRSVPVMLVILSFAIPLVSLFLTLLIIVSQLNLLVNLSLRTGKRPHERLVKNNNSRQHDFTKPFNAVNILMMSIYFNELVLLLFFLLHYNFCNNSVDNFFKGYVRCNNFSTNKFLTSDSVAIFNIFHQRKKKSDMSTVSITSDNNAFFLVIILVIFRVFNRKRRERLKLCYNFLFAIFLLTFQIKYGLLFNFNF